MKVLFLTRYGQQGASSRMRSLQYIPLLKKLNIDCTVSPLFDDIQLAERYRKNRYNLSSLTQTYWRRLLMLWQRKRYDLVWIEKEALPWFPAWVEKILLGNVPYALDLDDAIFHKYDQSSSGLVRHFLGKRIDRLMAGARLVVAGNAYLAQRAREAGAPWVEIVPTVIDIDRYDVKTTPHEKTDPLRIVWIGSPSTEICLDILHAPLAKLQEKHPFTLRIISGSGGSIANVNVERIAWSESTEMLSIQTCDVGIMPLRDTPWERGKCGYKLIQYMACGLPVVASPIGVNCDIVRNGENGYLAANEAEWIDSLSKLIINAQLRQQMGAVGRKLVEQEYCLQKVAPRLASLLQSATTDRC